MSDLSTKFSDLETQLAGQAITIGAYIDTVETKLQGIADLMDIMNENNAANTRYILSALTALDPCACTGSPTLVVPPVGTTPVGACSDTCKRVQAFLHTMQEIMTVLDVASAFSVGLNYTLIVNSFNEVITSIESGSDLPVISYPEAVNLVGAMINYIAGNIFVGGDLSTYFAGVLLDLRDGMIAGTDAASMQSLYNSVIDGSSLPSYVMPVMKGAAYGALYSYYFDPGTSPNLTGYDGGVCGCVECTEIESVVTQFDGDTPRDAIAWPDGFTAVNVTPAGYHSDKLSWCTDNLNGWTVTTSTNAQLREQYTTSPIALTAGVPYTLVDTNGVSIISLAPLATFTLTICPPGG